MFVYQTLAQYREICSLKDQPHGGRPHDICAQKRIHTVCERIQRNWLRKQKVMSRDVKISPRTMSYILKND